MLHRKSDWLIDWKECVVSHPTDGLQSLSKCIALTDYFWVGQDHKSTTPATWRTQNLNFLVSSLELSNLFLSYEKGPILTMHVIWEFLYSKILFFQGKLWQSYCDNNLHLFRPLQHQRSKWQSFGNDKFNCQSNIHVHEIQVTKSSFRKDILIPTCMSSGLSYCITLYTLYPRQWCI